MEAESEGYTPPTCDPEQNICWHLLKKVQVNTKTFEIPHILTI